MVSCGFQIYCHPKGVVHCETEHEYCQWLSHRPDRTSPPAEHVVGKGDKPFSAILGLQPCAIQRFHRHVHPPNVPRDPYIHVPHFLAFKFVCMCLPLYCPLCYVILPVCCPYADLQLGPPVVPFYTFLGEGSPTKIDYRRKGTLVLASLLEDLANYSLDLCECQAHPDLCFLQAGY